jgi:hypothetical protein
MHTPDWVHGHSHVHRTPWVHSVLTRKLIRGPRYILYTHQHTFVHTTGVHTHFVGTCSLNTSRVGIQELKTAQPKEI